MEKYVIGYTMGALRRMRGNDIVIVKNYRMHCYTEWKMITGLHMYIFGAACDKKASYPKGHHTQYIAIGPSTVILRLKIFLFFFFFLHVTNDLLFHTHVLILI